MKYMNKVLFGLLVCVSLGFAYYYGNQQGWFVKTTAKKTELEPTMITPTVSVSVTPDILPTISIPTGWKTFISEKYGFSISFPASYKALTDKDDLYGWPNGVVLLYNGGQSYDLAIEHWNSLEEYEKVYKNETRTYIKNIGREYISLLNMNNTTEVEKIIETFRSN